MITYFAVLAGIAKEHVQYLLNRFMLGINGNQAVVFNHIAGVGKVKLSLAAQFIQYHQQGLLFNINNNRFFQELLRVAGGRYTEQKANNNEYYSYQGE